MREDLDIILGIIKDRSRDSGFSEKEECIEIVDMLCEIYSI